MKITFLGTSHGYAEKNRYTSSTMLEIGGHIYLIDAGAPMEYIFVNRGIDWNAIRGVFITHMHSDHVAGLVTLIEPSLRFRFNDNITCFLPEEEGLNGFLSWLEALHCDRTEATETVTFAVTKPGVIFENEDLSVTAIPTMHFGGKYPAYSYMIVAEGKRVLFTGDMGIKFPDYLSIVGDRHYDLVVCEMAHASLFETQENLRKTDTSRMVINHYYKPRIEGYEEIFKTFPFDVSLAFDGREITV